MGVTILVVGMPAAKTFLFNISLPIFAFLIAKFAT